MRHALATIVFMLLATAGFALTHEEVNSAIDHYYQLAGFNADGAPTPEVLKKLDIEWAVEHLPT